jgi:hypothetical protein
LIPTPEQLEEVSRLHEGKLGATGPLGPRGEVPFAALLLAFSAHQRTLIVEVRRKQISKRIVFEHGVPVDCRSNLVHETLGRYMVAQGKLAADDLHGYLGQSASLGLPLGEVLLDHDVVTAEELFRVLQENLAKKLLDVFTWRDGDFRTHADVPHPQSPLKIRVPQLVVTGITKFAPQEEVDAAIGPLVNRKLCLHPNPPFALDEIRLSQRQSQVAIALRSGWRIDELALGTGLPFEEVTRLLYALAMLGMVIATDQLAARPAPGAVPPATATATPPGAPSAAGAPDQPDISAGPRPAAASSAGATPPASAAPPAGAAPSSSATPSASAAPSSSATPSASAAPSPSAARSSGAASPPGAASPTGGVSRVSRVPLESAASPAISPQPPADAPSPPAAAGPAGARTLRAEATATRPMPILHPSEESPAPLPASAAGEPAARAGGDAPPSAGSAGADLELAARPALGAAARSALGSAEGAAAGSAARSAMGSAEGPAAGSVAKSAMGSVEGPAAGSVARSAARSAAVPPAGTSASPPAGPPDAAGLPPGAPERRRNEIMQAYLSYRRLDSFDLLGADEDASPAAVESKYLEFARRFAPWTLGGPEFGGMEEKARDLFLAGARAYGELLDLEQRNTVLFRRKTRREERDRRAPADLLAIKTDLLDPEVQYRKGRALLDAGKFQEAAVLIEFASDCDPQNGLYSAELAYCRFCLAPGQGARALKELQETLRRDPDCGLAVYYTGEIHRQMGDRQEAEKILRRAIKMMAPDRRPIEALKLLSADRRR